MIHVRTPFRMIAALALAIGVSACAGTTTETATRNDTTAEAPVALNITKIVVEVPRSLEVSEANSYYPGGDIVWHGDPAGDRYAQVQAIFEDAMARGTKAMKTGVPAILDIRVERFHALTQKARYTVGGVHALTFVITLRDPKTGAPLAPSRQIKADLRGYGGDKAIEAEQRGETQKVRITEHLATVIQTELVNPGSYKSVDLGLMGMLNTL